MALLCSCAGPEHDYERSKVFAVFEPDNAAGVQAVSGTLKEIAKDSPRVELSTAFVEHAQILSATTQAVESGSDIVVVEANGLVRDLLSLAERHTDVQFILICDGDPQEPNLSIINPKKVDPSFRVGELLAKLTKRKCVGWLGPTIEASDGHSFDLFASGVKSIDPSIAIKQVCLSRRELLGLDGMARATTQLRLSGVDYFDNVCDSTLREMPTNRHDNPQTPSSAGVANRIATVHWKLYFELRTVINQYQFKQKPIAAEILPLPPSYPTIPTDEIVPDKEWNGRLSRIILTLQ